MSSTEQRTSGGAAPRHGGVDGVRRGRRLGSRLGDLLLTLASVGGVICILAVLAALVFKISLIMFSTGSMAPTIPTGSVAVVREIPAAAVDVGDVVTVDRPGQLPVTHRVRAVGSGPGDVRVLTLRGDANDQDDAVTYPVSTVRLVLFSVPGLAAAIVSLSDPFVLGGITVVMAGLVMWAFWPRRRADEALEDRGEEGGGDDAGAGRHAAAGGAVVESAAGAPAPHEPTAEAGGGRHRAVSTSTLAVLGLSVVIGSIWGAPPVRAQTVERVIEGSVLRLTTIGDDTAMSQMRPGVPVVWQVGVGTRTAEPGTIDLAMRVAGPLAGSPTGLQLQMSICDTRWTADRCADGERVVIAPGSAARYADRSYSFGSMPAGEERWILVTAWLPAGSSTQGRSATVTVAANGVGETVAAQPGVPGPAFPLPEPTVPLPVPGVPLPQPGPVPLEPTLPDTGVGTGIRTALFAGLVTLAGGLLLMTTTRRRRREEPCGA